jgi:hypothetical protein
MPGKRETGRKLVLFGVLGAVVVGALIVIGSQSTNSEIKTVRNGVLEDHNTTTVGKAFEGTFQSPKWTSFETPKKEVAVEFNGTVGPKVLEAAGLGFTLRQAGYGFYLGGRESCIASLGLKEKMEQEAQEAKKLATTLQEERQRVIEEAEAAWDETYHNDSHLFSYHGMERSWQNLRNLVAAESPISTSFHMPAETRRAMADIEDAEEQWKPINAKSAETESKITSCQESIPIPVKFQFVLSADKKTFRIQYIDDKAFGSATPNDILAFVYQ